MLETWCAPFNAGLLLTCDLWKLYLHSATPQGVPAICTKFVPCNCLTFVLCFSQSFSCDHVFHQDWMCFKGELQVWGVPCVGGGIKVSAVCRHPFKDCLPMGFDQQSSAASWCRCPSQFSGTSTVRRLCCHHWNQVLCFELGRSISIYPSHGGWR